MDHSTIITAAAREILRPAGLRQKGRSRIWLDDHGWWMAVVEFQPSGWGRGSYLNVGVMWLLYPQETIAFHDGHREHDFVVAEDEAQFRAKADDLCRLALARVEAHRARLSSAAAAHDRQEELLHDGQKRTGISDPWKLYFAGALALLGGRPLRTRELLDGLEAHAPTAAWERDVKRVGRELRQAAAPGELLARHVRATRAALRLPDIDIAFSRI